MHPARLGWPPNSPASALGRRAIHLLRRASGSVVIGNTPYWVQRWLRATLEISPCGHPDHRIVDALANDPRMEGLWRDAGDWPPGAQQWLIIYAFHFAQADIMSALVKPPDQRIELGRATRSLSLAAEQLVKAIEEYPDDAARLWAGQTVALNSIDPASIKRLAEKLRSFAEHGAREAEAMRSALDQVPTPNRRGRGDPRQLAYRSALHAVLKTLPAVSLSETQRDTITALLSSVIFGDDIDPETVRRTRNRQRRRVRGR